MSKKINLQKDPIWHLLRKVTIPASATLGQHLMRTKTNWAAGVPDDACETTQYGETEDYMINILPAAAYDIGITDITNPVTGSLTAAETVTVEIISFKLLKS